MSFRLITGDTIKYNRLKVRVQRRGEGEKRKRDALIVQKSKPQKLRIEPSSFISINYKRDAHFIGFE